MLSFFPRGVLDEILNLIKSVSEGFPSYSFITNGKPNQIKEIEEIHVMPDGLCFPRPTFLVPSATTVWKTFLGSELFLLTLQKRQVGQGNHGCPSKSFCVNATAVNCIR